MRCAQMLLMFSALIALVHSFPTGSEQNHTISFAQNVTHTHDDSKDMKPLTVIVEDKNPESKSVVVEFLYNSHGGNSVSELKGTERDKYIVDAFPHKEKQNQSQNLNETGKEKSAPQNITHVTGQKQVNEPKFDSSQMETDHQMNVQTSLIPNEMSLLTENWPKYFYDFLNPVQPFPELQYGRPNQINVKKIQRENANAYKPYYAKERKPVSVAGPSLNPLSIYDREFQVPIYE